MGTFFVLKCWRIAVKHSRPENSKEKYEQLSSSTYSRNGAIQNLFNNLSDPKSSSKRFLEIEMANINTPTFTKFYYVKGSQVQIKDI